jgi:hypothetical protein
LVKPVDTPGESWFQYAAHLPGSFARFVGITAYSKDSSEHFRQSADRAVVYRGESVPWEKNAGNNQMLCHWCPAGVA